MLFIKKSKIPKFEVIWEQKNTNGVLSEKKWNIEFDRGEYHNIQFLFGLTVDEVIELKDLLNKQDLS